MTTDTTQRLTDHAQDYVLGETREELILDSAEHQRLAAQRLLEQTRQRLYILSRDLDPAVFGTPEFADALARLARTGRYADIRIIIQDNRKLVQQAHRLREVIRLYSSAIQVRALHKRFVGYEQGFILADESGVCLRPHTEFYKGTLYFHHPLKARELREEFLKFWELSDPDPDLRQVGF